MGEVTEYWEDASVPFVVDDGTATAYVDPDGAEIKLSVQMEVTVEGGDEPPERIRAFLERETEMDTVHSRKRWFREHRIEAGDDVHVAGVADLDAVPDDVDEATVALVGDGATRFFVSDEPSHGLRDQLLREAFTAFFGAAFLFGFAWFLSLA